MNEPNIPEVSLSGFALGFKAIQYMGPYDILFVLAMLATFVMALLRTFGPTANTLMAAFPLALGAARALFLAHFLVPFQITLLKGESDLDIDAVIISLLAEIRILLILGLTFSILTFLAILFRNHRKATAA